MKRFNCTDIALVLLYGAISQTAVPAYAENDIPSKPQSTGAPVSANAVASVTIVSAEYIRFDDVASTSLLAQTETPKQFQHTMQPNMDVIEFY